MKVVFPPGLTAKQRLEFLVACKGEIVERAKSAYKNADAVSIEQCPELQELAHVSKSKVLYSNDEAKGVLKRTIVANTYNWLDSHGDVHINNLFSRSIELRGKRIPHLYDHSDSVLSKVGRPLQFYEQAIKWRALGHPKNGDTMALLMETEIQKDLNPGVYREYLNDQIDQHSVRMQYVKVDLAINDENYANEYKTWLEVYDGLGNKDEADAQGFFWAVREAKLIEVSAVLLASNELTPTLGAKAEPLRTQQDQQTTAPPRTPINVKTILNDYSKNILQNE